MPREASGQPQVHSDQGLSSQPPNVSTKHNHPTTSSLRQAHGAMKKNGETSPTSVLKKKSQNLAKTRWQVSIFIIPMRGGGLHLPGFVILKLPVVGRVLHFYQNKKAEDCLEISAGQEEKKSTQDPRRLTKSNQLLDYKMVAQGSWVL